MAGGSRNPHQEEAHRILSRVAQEADGSAMVPPASDRLVEEDWIETVGTRIGRVLGPLLLLSCAVWLLFHLFGGS